MAAAATPRPYNLSNAYGLAGPAHSVVYDAKGQRSGGYGYPYGPTVERPNPRLTNQIIELLRAAAAPGPVQFLPFHGLTAETPEMRRDYRNMLRNPYLKAAVMTNVLQVASVPYQVQPSKWPGPSAEEAAANVDYSLECVDGGFGEIVWNVLVGGMIGGHSVNEPRYDVPQFGPEAGRVVLDKFKARDDLTYRFDVDEFLNVTALQPLAFNYGGVFFDPADFVIYSHNKIYENPLGMSDFRSVWPAVQRYDMITRLEMIGLDKFALPFVVVKIPMDRPEYVASVDAAFAVARDNGFLRIPSGVEYEITNLLSAGGQEAFQRAKEDAAKEIVIGTTGAYLHILTSGKPDERGDSKVQKSTSELVPWWLSQQACHLLNRQWVPKQCRWNFGLDVAMPRVTMGGVNVAELLQDAGLDGLLLDMGIDLDVEERRAYYGRMAPASPQTSLLARRALVSMMGQPPPGQDGGPGGGGSGGGPGGGGLAFADGDDPLTFAGTFDESKHKRGQPHNAGQFGPGGGTATATTKRRWPNQAGGQYGTPTKNLPASLKYTPKSAATADPPHVAAALEQLARQFGVGAISRPGTAPAAPKPAPAPPPPKTRGQRLAELRDQTKRDLTRLEGSRDQEASFDRARLQHQLAEIDAELSGQPPPPPFGEPPADPQIQPTALPPPTAEETSRAVGELAAATEALTKVRRGLKSIGSESATGPGMEAALARVQVARVALDRVLDRVRSVEPEPIPFADGFDPDQPRDAAGRWAEVGASVAQHVERHRQTTEAVRAGVPTGLDARVAAHADWEAKKAEVVAAIREKAAGQTPEDRRAIYEVARANHFRRAAEDHREKVEDAGRRLARAHRELHRGIRRELARLAGAVPPGQAKAFARAMQSVAASLDFADDVLEFADWDESKHKRGQPKNRGQFGPGGGDSAGSGGGGSSGGGPAGPTPGAALGALMELEFGGKKKVDEDAPGGTETGKRYPNEEVRYLDSERLKGKIELDTGRASDGKAVYRWSDENADHLGPWTDSKEDARAGGLAFAATLKKPATGFGPKWRSGLTPEEKDVFATYSLDSDSINGKLRSGFHPGEIADVMDKAIRRSVLPQDLTVYRGITSDPGLSVGDQFGDRAYVSTSHSRTIAEEFMAGHRDTAGGVLFEITAPKGARGADTAGLSPSHGSEAEVLFPRGSRFHVTGVRDESGSKVYEVKLATK